MNLTEIVAHVPYCWPFLAYCVISAVLTEIVERIFQKRMGEPWFWVYPRRLSAILPIVLGGVFGYLVMPEPIPYKLGAAGSGLLFALSGAVGIILYDPLRDWLQKKYGIKIQLPGEDEPPQV